MEGKRRELDFHSLLQEHFHVMDFPASFTIPLDPTPLSRDGCMNLVLALSYAGVLQ
jgi:hypothetical protein